MNSSNDEKNLKITKEILALILVFMFDGMLFCFSCYQMQDGWPRWAVFVISLLILAYILAFMNASIICVKESDFDLKMRKFDTKSK